MRKLSSSSNDSMSKQEQNFPQKRELFFMDMLNKNISITVVSSEFKVYYVQFKIKINEVEKPMKKISLMRAPDYVADSDKEESDANDEEYKSESKEDNSDSSFEAGYGGKSSRKMTSI